MTGGLAQDAGIDGEWRGLWAGGRRDAGFVTKRSRRRSKVLVPEASQIVRWATPNAERSNVQLHQQSVTVRCAERRAYSCTSLL